MKPQTASKTALIIAAYRGRASAQPNPVCSDRWAALLAGTEGNGLAERLDPIVPHRELWVAVRTAYLDGEVKRWISAPSSITQVIILGAGLDTRAERLGRQGVRFFEVDHPASQEEKLRRLAELPRYPVDCATYVACDFEKDDLLQTLVARGFRVGRSALIVWD